MRRLVDDVVTAVVRDPWFAERHIEHGDELVEASRKLSCGRLFASEHRRVESRATRTDTEDQPARRNVVERHRLLRQQEWVPKVRRRDQGSEADPRRRSRDARQPRDGSKPRPLSIVAPGEMVVGPHVVVTEGLDPLSPRHGLGPRIGWQHHDADAHANSLATLRRGRRARALSWRQRSGRLATAATCRPARSRTIRRARSQRGCRRSSVRAWSRCPSFRVGRVRH